MIMMNVKYGMSRNSFFSLSYRLLCIGFLQILCTACFKDVNKPLIYGPDVETPKEDTIPGVVPHELIENQISFFSFAIKKRSEEEADLPNPRQRYNPSTGLRDEESLLEVEHSPEPDDAFAGGDGSPQTPYLIETFEQLSQVCTRRQAFFQLKNDIQANDKKLSPLCPNKTEPFVGKFDGKGFRIINLSLEENSSQAGLFANLGVRLTANNTKKSVLFGLLMDLILENPTIQGGKQTGAFVGQLRGRILNCHVISGRVSFSEDFGKEFEGFLGGIAGWMGSDAIIRYATVSATVKGLSEGEISQTVGGIVGHNRGIVERSYVMNVDIEGSHNVGGIAGQNLYVIRRCASLANVRATGRNVGGIIGNSADKTLLEDSFATGEVSGENVVGGLIGRWNNVSLSGSANETPIIDGIIARSYASNNLLGGEKKGGIVGENHLLEEDEGGFLSVYWNTDLSSGEYPGDKNRLGGIPNGRTEQQLRCPTEPNETCNDVSSFVGWANDVWFFGTAEQLPVLRF
ncbi:MAG: hypothetical protein OXB93_05425 [Cytophagales bacterium]|nr:hypothetical protein [Cytophagales bacterium]